MATWTFPNQWSVTVDDARVVALPEIPRSQLSPRELVKAALEKPLNFEPMRRALTPDDRVCIVLDERLPHLAELISGVLDHLATAGIDPVAVTLLSPEPNSRQTWIDELPDELSDVKTEVHSPADRKHLSYLAATKIGEPIYLNRTLVEAEFIIVLGGHRHDNLPGEAWLVPGVCDAEYQKNAAALKMPRDESESLWLLGMPFFVRVIEGADGGIDSIVAGFSDSNTEASRQRDARWNRTVTRQPATVIVESHSSRFDELAAIVASAERVVAPQGRIVVLMKETPRFPEAVEVLQHASEPEAALKKLRTTHPDGWRAAARWAECTQSAALFLAGPLPQEACEELFATSIATASELQRLVNSGGDVMYLPDALLAQVDYQKAGSK